VALYVPRTKKSSTQSSFKSPQKTAFSPSHQPAPLPWFAQATLQGRKFSGPFEQEADRVAERVMRVSDSNRSVSLTGLELSQSPQPLDLRTREFLEKRFDDDFASKDATRGFDFSRVRLHSDGQAAAAASALKARAFTVGSDVFFGSWIHGAQSGRKLAVLAHELSHVVQQTSGRHPVGIQCYGGDPIPDVANPSVKTMRDFIDLIRKVEAANPGKTALNIAQSVMRAKYHSTGWDWLLPSSSNVGPPSATGKVTEADVTTLSGEFDVQLPQGGIEDPSHVIASIVAANEAQAPGAGGAGGLAGHLVQDLPSGVSQLDVASWAGDPASAAAEWETVHPHPKGGTTKQAYMDEYSPESDMIGDVDGIAVASKSSATGFVFDMSKPLSDNLERFYFPTAPREGKNRRFHMFCAAEGFSLEADGVTLSGTAIVSIDNRVHALTDYFTRNDPNLLTWVAATVDALASEFVARGNDWQWFSAKFREFIRRNLSAEGR
jgi:hypothetical protein